MFADDTLLLAIGCLLQRGSGVTPVCRLPQVCSACRRAWLCTESSSERRRAGRGRPSVSPSSAPWSSACWPPGWAESPNSVSGMLGVGLSCWVFVYVSWCVGGAFVQVFVYFFMCVLCEFLWFCIQWCEFLCAVIFNQIVCVLCKFACEFVSVCVCVVTKVKSVLFSLLVFRIEDPLMFLQV